MPEYFEIYNEKNAPLGLAKRNICHGNPKLCHKTVHLIIFNNRGEILLQKRSLNKDIQPGKWDTAVGGHINPGENIEEAVIREMNEELGISLEKPLIFLFELKERNSIESENISVFSTFYNGNFAIQEEELDEVKFWKIDELKSELNSNSLTPLCKKELIKLFAEQ
ncbi:MAG TPA: NUDIX domain-containing protein [Victivallales bacterium]|nr:NUDIX domain-containing protein [Victivallales bacterium]